MEGKQEDKQKDKQEDKPPEGPEEEPMKAFEWAKDHIPDDAVPQPAPPIII